jgi:hypothetical protein
MKWRSLLAVAGALALATPALGQGTFQNLGFEAAQLVFVGFTREIAVTNALPGWAAWSEGNQLTTVPYNLAAGVPRVGLYGSNSYVLSGSFGIFLSASGTVTQTGLVPADSQSLRFKASWRIVSPVISLGGQELPLVLLDEASNYSLYGVDVTGFAGQAATLSFAAPLTGTRILIDDIAFSPEPIPEPSASVLIGLVSVCFTARWVHRRSKRGG